MPVSGCSSWIHFSSRFSSSAAVVEHALEGRHDLDLVGEVAGDVRVGSRDTAQGHGDARLFRHRGDDFGTHAARLVFFVHDDQPRRVFRRCQHGSFVPRGERTEVEDIAADADSVQRFRDPFAQPHGVAPRHERDIASGADLAGRANRRELPLDVAGRLLFRVVEQGLGIEEDRRTTRLERGVQQTGRIAGRGGHEHINSRHVGGQRFVRARMERAHARTVSAAGHHHDHGRLIVPVAAPVDAAQLVAPAGCRPAAGNRRTE